MNLGCLPDGASQTERKTKLRASCDLKNKTRPRTDQAMYQLIAEIREQIPLDLPESTLCVGPCEGCSKKLLEYLDDQLCDWQVKLSAGVIPNLGDIHALGKSARKIRRVLVKNGFIRQ